MKTVRSSRPLWWLCFGLAALHGGAEAASVYKWVDRQGVVQYDDQTRTAERLTRASIAKRAVASSPSARAPVDFIAEVARHCQDVSTRRASYASARELYGRDPAGNQYRFSDYQMALERARLADEMRRFCQPLAAEKLLAEARANALKTGTAVP